MSTISRPAICLLLLVCFSATLSAREQAGAAGPKSSPLITAATAGERVRFSSAAGVCQMRVQILSASGDALFDSAWKDGNVLDWPIDSADHPLAAGSYRCVVMVKDLEGQVTQKEATVTAQGGQVSIEQRAGTEGLTIVGAEENGPKITMLAHDGQNGAVVSTSGDLSFRFGNFLAGKDSERMRLTAEGNLGIGTDKPQAQLDVNGLIRTSKGIMFSDGTILTTAAGVAATGESGGVIRQRPGAPGIAPVIVRGGVEPRSQPSATSARLTPRPTFAPAFQFVVGDAGVSVGTTNPAYRLDVTGEVNTGTMYAISNSPVLSSLPPGGGNTIVGILAAHNTTGTGNTVIGDRAGGPSMSGFSNVLVGESAGGFSSTGLLNTAVGQSAGENITTESYNTLLGSQTDIQAGVNNATAIGHASSATQSNTVILGTSDTSTGIGTTTPNQRLGVGGGITVDAGNANNGTLTNTSNTVLAFGAGASNLALVSGEAIASQRTAGAGQYGLDFYTNYAKRMSIANNGTVNIVGMLTKGSGSFKIDHPLDPENKYLYHSFVESPDMMNIYNGNVVLDDHGEAVVQLPDWFEALNQDFRYQLTCLHGFAPVYIDEEISENRFKIAGGKPGMKVSWQVTGIRHDAYANAHRIPVEESKPAEERGTLLYPAGRR